MNDIYSFYQLISKYRIEIPIIQRDYAQGRNDTKSSDVRKSIVNRLILATKDNQQLFFDFVYGRADGDKFIPFDGQQRLTTLFLFHRYVFEKCQSSSACHYKSNCICNDILLRFTYATRQSSREFCERLVNEKVIPDDAKPLSENVRNMPWFYSDWEKDPTIMGMLTMLDEIHGQMKDIDDFRPLAEKLTSGCNCPITFHFVDMGEHKLTDDTYVKMNARGKTLTPFENFKASLEQYLVDKAKTDLLERVRGKFDEDTQKYTGIDGVWLEMFWDAVNEDKEKKELPDTLMMSFFNRHFMNVWRCWYANHSKSNENKEQQDEYDSFQNRIITEMPLYPTKDNFVSWDIYQCVLDKCGIDECLTPIFNIWDELCKGNNINEDCQAVWNRGNDKEKWNLFEGNKNNDNRETYPSRVAFYALLRYFGVETKENKTTLSQWMRIVWNIIENSTIDSSGTYQAALRLMCKLSDKCYNIHDALANHFADFQLGSPYHAQDQVAEEIAKAKQILYEAPSPDGKSWEEIIIDAEKYAFFKGAIRFLFTDGEGNINWYWCDFDKKWTNAKKYFDENGIVEGYKKEAILLRAFLSRINIEEKWFGYYNDFWRLSLLSTDNQSVINHLLTTEKIDIEEACGRDWIKNKELIETLLESYNSWHILNNWRKYSVLTRYSQRRSDVTSHKEIVVLNDLRNKLLNEVKAEISPEIKVGNTTYLYGWNINFKFNNHFFQWWGNPNEKELDVYLMEDDWKDYKERPNPTTDKGTDEYRFYCFRVDANEDADSFVEKLDNLIKQDSLI